MFSLMVHNWEEVKHLTQIIFMSSWASLCSPSSASENSTACFYFVTERTKFLGLTSNVKFDVPIIV